METQTEDGVVERCEQAVAAPACVGGHLEVIRRPGRVKTLDLGIHPWKLACGSWSYNRHAPEFMESSQTPVCAVLVENCVAFHRHARQRSSGPRRQNSSPPLFDHPAIAETVVRPGFSALNSQLTHGAVIELTRPAASVGRTYLNNRRVMRCGQDGSYARRTAQAICRYGQAGQRCRRPSWPQPEWDGALWAHLFVGSPRNIDILLRALLLDLHPTSPPSHTRLLLR